MKRRRPRKPIPEDSSPEERALDVLALMRRQHVSLRRAADLTRTDPRTVRRHAGTALRKRGGRWAPTAFDRIPRRVTVLTAVGPEEVVVRDSRTASALASHANAVRIYREEFGNERPLRSLRRTRVRINGRDYDLVTDPVRLDRLAAGGELHFELYRT